jgi:glycosyltransferase involved in cell wall biosynthesis
MKVLLAITKSNFGGAQRYVFDMAMGARTAGYNVSVLTGGKGILVDKLSAERIPTITLPSLGRDVSLFDDLRAMRDMVAVLKRERPHVLHLNSSKMGLLGALSGRIMGVPRIIFTAHGWAFNEARPWWQRMLLKKLMWWTVLLSHTTVCVSEQLKRDMQWPFTSKKLVVIHNGIDVFPLEKRAHEPGLTVGTLSELHYTKGLDIALKGFAQVLKDTDARFVIIGEGEEKIRLEHLVMTLGISRQVHFAGFVPDAREKLSNFDIFTLTSRTEGLPYVLLEAGAASLPVIASAVGGIPEVIHPGHTGLLFEKENVSAFADTLKRLASDQSLRMHLGANLYNLVTKTFTRHAMLDKTLALY